MQASISLLKFRFDWRPYQATILRHFSTHIQDNHFHIIAPPGSGKTILGLELIKRLGKKTLVLAPTLTIRNQWEDRLQQFFTTNGDFENISFDIESPSDITFSTYQGLYAFYKTCPNKETYYQFFKTHNIDVLVLDEAHHLKNSWWTCLYQLKEQYLQTVVALTATPPYDSSQKELKKYFNLCGEIDDEIVVPDLVKEKNLCPHQDLIYYCKPLEKEINTIVNFRLKIADFTTSLLEDQYFTQILKQHRFYTHSEDHLTAIYKNPDVFSALLIFLNEVGINIPPKKLELLGFKKYETLKFPKLSHEWMEILLQYIIVTDRAQLSSHEWYLSTFEKQLRQLSVFQNNSINLLGSTALYKSLSSSPSKLNSIIDIVIQEEHNLSDGLRCVILTDYIRNEYLNTPYSEVQTINKLGVLPIFQHLKASVLKKQHLAVLTGSIVIIHATNIAKLEGIDSIDKYIFLPLTCDSEFVCVTPKSSNNNIVVNSLTALFEQGYIKVLIGTTSLLGEGWDAPSINSLILASAVGSFVTSNQMRGRAIRIDQNNMSKAAIIWHLACIDVTVDNGGKDLEVLSKRFDAFLGIDLKTNTISNGIHRLHLPSTIGEEQITILNTASKKASQNRHLISEAWENAIGQGKTVARELTLIPKNPKHFDEEKKVYTKDIVRMMFGELAIGFSFFIPQFILKNFNIIVHKGVLYFLYSLISALLLTFGYKLYVSIQLYFKFGFIDKKILTLGHVVLYALKELNYITTATDRITLKSERRDDGNVVCVISGTTRLESNLFIAALSDLLSPVNNPKYLIATKHWFRKKIEIQHFFPVPEIIAQKKENTLIFQKHWNSTMGTSILIYTRTLKGRKSLIKARLFHLNPNSTKNLRQAAIWK